MRKVLYSPGYGAGWSTWHREVREEQEFMLFHPGLIEAIERQEVLGYRENGTHSDPRKRVQSGSPLAQFLEEWVERFGDENLPYLGGTRDLQVELLDGPFRVDEYDGNESLIQAGAEMWF